jgi:hypothetical protein
MTERSSAETAAAEIIEIDQRKCPTRHGLREKIHRRIARDVVLATQIIEGADQTAPTVAVMVMAACPALAVCEKLDQEIEHLNRIIRVARVHRRLLL